MGNLRLGDWRIDVPGHTPSIGDTATATIAGKTYSTVIMPDGKEWTTTNAAYVSTELGRFWNGASTDNGRGAYYNPVELLALDALLEDGWRVVRLDGDVAGLITALEPDYPTDGDRAAYLAEAPLSLLPVGYYSNSFAEWYDVAQQPYSVTLCLGDSPSHTYTWGIVDGSVFQLDDGFVFLWDDGFVSMDQRTTRFVRDALPSPSAHTSGTHTSGTHDILILPSGLAETTESLAQRVDVRLRTFFGEHWLNPELGVPWFRDFLVKSPDLAACRQILYDIIRGVRGVQAVNALTLSLSKGTRILSITFAVNGSDAFTSTIPV